jgi:hypothetical protein
VSGSRLAEHHDRVPDLNLSVIDAAVGPELTCAAFSGAEHVSEEANELLDAFDHDVWVDAVVPGSWPRSGGGGI